MVLSGIQHRLSHQYLANISWTIANNACKHFSKFMPMEDFVARAAAILIWPRSELGNFPYQMTSAQDINLITFPTKWTTMLECGETVMHVLSTSLKVRSLGCSRFFSMYAVLIRYARWWITEVNLLVWLSYDRHEDHARHQIKRRIMPDILRTATVCRT